VSETTALHAGARVALVGCGAALLGFAIYSSIRLSYADLLFHKNTSQSVEQAARLEPANGRYQAWLAERLENDGQDPTPALERAARLNPLDSRVWIRRGLAAEMNGNRADAERLLLHAAAIDRLMEPRWALMNFYFRGGEGKKFWPWARQTFDISYGDRTPLFDLCWRMRDEAGFIASEALPSKYAIRFQFMQFLLAKKRFVDAASVADRILPQAAGEDRGTFIECIDRLAGSGEMLRATSLWNALCARGLLSLRPLNPGAGDSLTNGMFEYEPLGAGFDWRMPTTPGVTPLRTARTMRFTFNGEEPEQCRVIWQRLPLEPSRRYQLRFSYRTSGIRAASGLQLRVLGRSTPSLSSDEWTEQRLLFDSGPERGGEVAIEYQRPPGFVRVEGTLELRGFTLGFAQ
jgi:hypothetical protein